LDIQREVSVRHIVHLWIADVHHRGRRKPFVTNSGPSAKTPSVGLWKSSILPVNPCTSGRVFSGLNPHAGPYYLFAMISQGFPIGTPIFQPSVGTSSSSSLGASPNRDSTEDYPEIGDSICWNPVVEDRCINMVAPTGAPSQNSSSRYPTIRRSEASEAWTPATDSFRI
jgi:hypothetical protein